MHVFMLGWEFPPFISGGLGTACYGLTKAMGRQGMDVTFVLPKAIGSEYTSHVKLLSPQSPRAATGARDPQAVASTYRLEGAVATGGEPPAGTREFTNIVFKAVPSRITSPYGGMVGEGAGPDEGEARQALARIGMSPEDVAHFGFDVAPATQQEGNGHSELGIPHHQAAAVKDNYDGDLMTESRRYAGLCLDLARGENIDVIHAHDWLTYPAGMAVARATGKPLVVHVHSTEFDRSGENINLPVYDIERRGMHAATKVICVSYLTARIAQHKYRVDPSKIHVVYNGVENGNAPVDAATRARIRGKDKIVLFLGRITLQKGPEYFVMAAKKVLEKYQDVIFVMAGSGDKFTDISQLAEQEDIADKVVFTGFLRGKDVERVFKAADVYVMPSVSEPFGIAPLEAISHDVPVIISKQSGVAEVLTHALKVDFWDTDEMANKIVAVLRHPPLSHTLRHHADIELRGITWDGAARKCGEVYESAIAAMG